MPRSSAPIQVPVEHVFWLRPSAAAPSLARNWVRWVCAEVGVPLPAERALAFIAGEFVAVSVRQVRAPLDLGVSVTADQVSIRVLNRSAQRSARVPAGAAVGRHVPLVDCVADAWGNVDTEDGQLMWATVVRPRSRRRAAGLVASNP